jgi:hypothetical protein
MEDVEAVFLRILTGSNTKINVLTIFQDR